MDRSQIYIPYEWNIPIILFVKYSRPVLKPISNKAKQYMCVSDRMGLQTKSVGRDLILFAIFLYCP